MGRKNNRNLFFISLAFLCLMCGTVFSQQLNYTLNRDFLWGFDNYYNDKEQNSQTFVKPYRFEDLKSI